MSTTFSAVFFNNQLDNTNLLITHHVLTPMYHPCACVSVDNTYLYILFQIRTSRSTGRVRASSCLVRVGKGATRRGRSPRVMTRTSSPSCLYRTWSRSRQVHTWLVLVSVYSHTQFLCCPFRIALLVGTFVSPSPKLNVGYNCLFVIFLNQTFKLHYLWQHSMMMPNSF